MSDNRAKRIDLGTLTAPVEPELSSAQLLAQEDAFEREMAAAAARGDDAPEETIVAFERPAEPTIEELQAELKALEQQEQRSKLMAELKAKRAQLKDMAVAKALVPVHDPVRDSPNTWILMHSDMGEVAVSEAWIDTHCPAKKDQRMLETVLNLQRLRMDDSVMLMIRGKNKQKPLGLVRDRMTDQGERFSEAENPDALMAEMVLTPAIACKDHWKVGAGIGRYSGELDQASFVNAIGALCTPLVPRFADAASAKPPELPKLLLLRYL